jgi:hypothetical protein
LDGAKGIIDVPIQARLSVTTAEAVVWAAVWGMGVTRALYHQCADAVREGLLRIILGAFELEPLPTRQECFAGW